MKIIYKLSFLYLFFLFFFQPLSSQNAVTDSIKSYLLRLQKEQNSISNYRLNSFKVNDKKRLIQIRLSDNFAKIPFKEAFVDTLKNNIKAFLPKENQHYKIDIFANNENIENLVPNIYRDRIDIDKSRFSKKNIEGEKFVFNSSRDFRITQGLQWRNIALWNSHGWYYEQKLDRWEWQRARILTTVEDKFTTQVVMNFLLPMLENAGANVFMPKERDIQPNIIICDKDSSWNSRFNQHTYRELGDMSNFKGEIQRGFSDKKEFYEDRENPFRMGNSSMIATEKKANAWVEYIPNIKKSGWYSVSVCYVSIKNGIEDAHYSVYHSGGKTNFTVNQTIGGGTWIYLGTFFFDASGSDRQRRVVLSNQSRKGDAFVVSDAVKFGGGIGNIARKPATQNTIDSIPDANRRKNAKLLSSFNKETATPSRRARFWEGARYYLQWAGMPFEVYSHTFGINDYIDDYASRGKWVNFLNKGSENAPDSVGLGIPIDLSIAFHSDAGIDTIKTVGSMGIVTTNNNGKTIFPNKQSRYSSVDMANIILNEIKRDIDKTFDVDWTIRGVNNASYAESRMPDVPSMILESMSHQNFNDMRLGLNPKFQFTFARAVYKGILKFLSEQNHKSYKVQPLPVTDFSAIIKHNSVQLKWSPTLDSLEKTAKPKGYVVYIRKNNIKGDTINQGFDNGFFLRDTTITLHIEKDTIFSYKITAVNDGGESFPSEILSVCNLSNAKGEVLVVNGFTKVAAPQAIDEPTQKGFPSWGDYAIPYKVDYSYTGEQHNFDITKEWKNDDSPGFGASYGNYEQAHFAGNSLDYPIIDGKAIAKAGFSFSSSSVGAVEKGSVSLKNVKIMDVILGKQKREVNPFSGKMEYHTFSDIFKEKIKLYLTEGNSLFLSGAYIGKDLCEKDTDSDKDFAKNTLNLLWRTDKAAKNFNAVGVYSPIIDISSLNENFVSSNLNDYIYPTESVDAIEPANNKAYTVMRYEENSMSAAIAFDDKQRLFICGFPFEAIKGGKQRDELMEAILQFFNRNR